VRKDASEILGRPKWKGTVSRDAASRRRPQYADAPLGDEIDFWGERARVITATM